MGSLLFANLVLSNETIHQTLCTNSSNISRASTSYTVINQDYEETYFNIATNYFN